MKKLSGAHQSFVGLWAFVETALWSECGRSRAVVGDACEIDART
jgi:hypothetical protein